MAILPDVYCGCACIVIVKLFCNSFIFLFSYFNNIFFCSVLFSVHWCRIAFATFFLMSLCSMYVCCGRERESNKNDDESLGVVRVWFIPLKISTFNAHCFSSTWSSLQKINLKSELNWVYVCLLIAFFLPFLSFVLLAFPYFICDSRKCSKVSNIDSIQVLFCTMRTLLSSHHSFLFSQYLWCVLFLMRSERMQNNGDKTWKRVTHQNDAKAHAVSESIG